MFVELFSWGIAVTMRIVVLWVQRIKPLNCTQYMKAVLDYRLYLSLLYGEIIVGEKRYLNRNITKILKRAFTENQGIDSSDFWWNCYYLFCEIKPLINVIN